MKKQTVIRAVSIAMAAAMLAGLQSVSVFAADNTSSSASSEGSENAAMKTALTKVKERITIPEHISEFSYDVNTNKYQNADCYYFSWTTDDAKVNESVEVAIAGDTIISYSYYKYDTEVSSSSSAPKFAELSDEELTAKAKEYITRLNPDMTSVSDIEITSISLYNQTAVISFGRKENGVTVDGNGGRIRLDKDTGELTDFYINDWFYDDTEFSSTKDRITASEAREKYKEYCTLTPSYRIVADYDSQTKDYTYSPVLIYTPDFTGEIDALTGEKSSIWDDCQADNGTKAFPFSRYSYAEGYEDDMEIADTTAAMDTGAGERIFTEAELREIEADESLLKKDEITELLQKDPYIELPDYVPLQSSYLTKNEDDNTYTYSLWYRYSDDNDIEVAEVDYAEDEIVVAAEEEETHAYYSLSVSVDAESGKVSSFYKNTSQNYVNSEAYPVKKNNAIAEKAAEYYYSDIFGEYKADESNTAPSESWTNKDGTKYYETSRQFVYHRYVNDVIVEGDNIYITIDNKGNVTSLSCSYTDVEFPTSVPEFDNDKAFASIFKQISLNLYYDGYYKPDGTSKAYLLYDIGSFIINSKYQLVNWFGEVIENTADSTEYSDIEGIKQQNAIETLKRYGIALESQDSKFNPTKAITEEEFSYLLKSITYGRYVSYNDSDEEEEKSPALTNKTAAKMFTTNIGLSEAAELEGIFIAPFDDVSSDDEYAGYIAIAKAKGFMTGSDGKFYPDNKISRARAIQIIYNYILSFSE